MKVVSFLMSRTVVSLKLKNTLLLAMFKCVCIHYTRMCKLCIYKYSHALLPMNVFLFFSQKLANVTKSNVGRKTYVFKSTGSDMAVPVSGI